MNRRDRLRALILPIALLSVGGVGCGGGGPDALSDPFAVAPTCTSGRLLDPNEQPSPWMSPGRPCIACHVEENTASGEEGDAPVFTFAGTVFPTGHEPDHCSGAPAAGAVVQLIDARGLSITSVVNDGGNFFERLPGFAFPYTARISFQGRTRVMLQPQRDGDCNACHTQDGTNSDAGGDPAPGRIVLP